MGIRRNSSLMEQATDYVEAAVETAQDKAGPVLADAKEAVADTMTDKVAPLLAAGAAIAAEKISAAADLAAEKAAEGKEAAAAKSAELNGEKKKHRVRNFLIFGAIVAALGFIASKLRSGSDQENWQSSYTPAPPPAAAGDTPQGVDEGGAGPDEAIADAVEEPHDVTTPEDPADIVQLDSEEEAAKKS